MLSKQSLTILLILFGVATQARAASMVDLMVNLPTPWKNTGWDHPGERKAQMARWAAPDNKEVQINFWPTQPPHDGGPMVVAKKHKVTVAGRKTDIIETSLFQGRKAHVLVVFLQRGDSWYRIVGRNISVREFETILATAVFTQ